MKSLTRDSSRISNIFNEHFASVGSKLANILPPSQQLYDEFLSKSKSPESSFLFKFVTADEVKIEILSIPNNVSWSIFLPYQNIKMRE